MLCISEFYDLSMNIQSSLFFICMKLKLELNLLVPYLTHQDLQILVAVGLHSLDAGSSMLLLAVVN